MDIGCLFVILAILFFILLANYGIEIDTLKKQVKELEQAEYMRCLREQRTRDQNLTVENCVSYRVGPPYPENIYPSSNPEIPDE